MDFDLREWLLILGPVFICGILLHGYLRMRNSQNNIRMKLDKSFMSAKGDPADVSDDLSLLKAELPNGGARVVRRPEQVSLDLDDEELTIMRGVSARDEDVPVLRESVNVASVSATGEVVGHKRGGLVGTSDNSSDNSSENNSVNASPNTSFKDDSPKGKSTRKAPPAKKPIDSKATADSKEAATSKKSVNATEKSGPVSEAKSGGTNPVAAKPEKFVVIYVLANREPFAGQQLVETLVESDMAFGELDIFHRLDANDDPLFSLASAVEPGVFDMATMDKFTTPGITMFMRAHELEEPLFVFDEMLKVAENIAGELNGEIRDDTRSVMTPQTIEHCRQSIREFQFKHSA